MRYLFFIFLFFVHPVFSAVVDAVPAKVADSSVNAYCIINSLGSRKLTNAQGCIDWVYSFIGKSWKDGRLVTALSFASAVPVDGVTATYGANITLAASSNYQGYSGVLSSGITFQGANQLRDSYTCPPADNPDYTVLSDSAGVPSSSGKFCSIDASCEPMKGQSINPAIDMNKFPTHICYEGCLADNAAPMPTGKYLWVQPWSFSFSGKSCSGNSGWVTDYYSQNYQLAESSSKDALKSQDSASASAANAAASTAAADASTAAAQKSADQAKAAADAAKALADAAANKAQVAVNNVTNVYNNSNSTVIEQAAASENANAAAQAAKQAAAAAQAAIAQAQAAAAQAAAAAAAQATANAAMQAAAEAAQAAIAQAQAAAAQAQAAYEAAIAAAESASAQAADAAAAAAAKAAAAAQAAADAAAAAAGAASDAAGAAGAAADAATNASGSGGGSGGGESGSDDDNQGDGYGNFSGPSDSKDYLAGVFSADSISDLVQKQGDLQEKITNLGNDLKVVFGFSSVAMPGALSADIHEIRGAEVDFSGMKFFQGMSGIRGVLWLVTVLGGISVILFKGK